MGSARPGMEMGALPTADDSERPFDGAFRAGATVERELGELTRTAGVARVSLMESVLGASVRTGP